MDSKFEYDVDGIKWLRNDIVKFKENMSNIVQELKKDVNNLNEEWQSPTSMAFVERYNELCSSVGNAIEAIGNLEMTLTVIADNIINSEPKF